jgi:hypothetical protein
LQSLIIKLKKINQNRQRILQILKFNNRYTTTQNLRRCQPPVILKYSTISQKTILP